MKNFELWDSLSHMNLMLEIEKKFSFQFTTKEFAQLNNYKKIFQRLKNIK
jgi:acyl carrier protein